MHLYVRVCLYVSILYKLVKLYSKEFLCADYLRLKNGISHGDILRAAQAAASPALLFRVGQNVRFQICGLGKLLIATLKSKCILKQALEGEQKMRTTID